MCIVVFIKQNLLYGSKETSLLRWKCKKIVKIIYNIEMAFDELNKVIMTSYEDSYRLTKETQRTKCT